MNLFLRAKHWQLFLLTFGIPILLNIIMMADIFSSLMEHQGDQRDPALVFDYFKFFPLIMLLFIGGLLGWQWSVAIGLQKMVPAGIKMKVTKFKIFFFIPVVYILLLLAGISFLFSSGFSNATQAGFDYRFVMPFFLLIPLHLFSMFCLFYCIYFVSKTMKTVELQREVSFSDFAGEFFLTWFFPIGVWILQPKINKLVNGQGTSGVMAQPLN
jgi:hypothetical protein